MVNSVVSVSTKSNSLKSLEFKTFINALHSAPLAQLSGLVEPQLLDSGCLASKVIRYVPTIEAVIKPSSAPSSLKKFASTIPPLCVPS